MDSKCRYLFVPDLYKFEQSFDVFASNVDEAAKIAYDLMCCNCYLSVYSIYHNDLSFIGCVAFRENEEPTWLVDAEV